MALRPRPGQTHEPRGRPGGGRGQKRRECVDGLDGPEDGGAEGRTAARRIARDEAGPDGATHQSAGGHTHDKDGTEIRLVRRTNFAGHGDAPSSLPDLLGRV